MLALVLGGGAAKGYAHIGVLKLLREMNIKPELVVGASIGALVGAFYAAGFSIREIEDIAVKIDRGKKRALFPIRFNKRGLINGKAILAYLGQYLADKKIEDLPIKYAAVATDIEEHKELIIDRGDLLPAVRAAISIPVVFIPYHYQGRVLVDGGFVNPVPIDIAARLGAKRIIAVNVLRYVTYGSEFLSVKDNPNRQYDFRSVASKIIDYIFSRLVAANLPDPDQCLLININTSRIKVSQFERAREAIDIGYREAQQYRQDIIKFVSG